jgi:hypothetical protein
MEGVYTAIPSSDTITDVDIAFGRFKLPSAAELNDAWLVSINLAQKVFGEGGHRYNSGYAMDWGYGVGESISHIGLDIDGVTTDHFYSPVSGTMVGYNGSGENKYILLKDDGADRVWLLAHIEPDSDLLTAWSNRLTDGASQIIGGKAGTDLGTLTNHSGGAHLHVAAQDMSQGIYSAAQLEYTWSINGTTAWGQSTNEANIVESTISPLQAYYEYNEAAALLPTFVYAQTTATVTGSAGRGGGVQDGDAHIESINHIGRVHLGAQSILGILAQNDSTVALDSSAKIFAILSRDAVLSQDDVVLADGIGECRARYRGAVGRAIDAGLDDIS